MNIGLTPHRSCRVSIPPDGSACWLALLLLVAAAPARAQGPAPSIDGPPVAVPPQIAHLPHLNSGAFSSLQVTQARARFRVDGSGLAVVVLGSGINLRHKAFAENKVTAKVNFSAEGDGAEDIDDRLGQGSHLAATVAGLPCATMSDGGVAPGARIVALKVVGKDGQTEARNVNRALDWVLEHRTIDATPISAVLLALGIPGNFKTETDPGVTVNAELSKMRENIAKLQAAKIAVVTPAGNRYVSFAPGQGMGFPAICPETISVGAVYDRDIPTDIPAQDERPILELPTAPGGRGVVIKFARAEHCLPFSQRLGAGPDGKDPHRTDIFAPGFLIASAGISQADDPENCIALHSGTDQSAAHVAGVVLLLQQQYQRLIRSFVKDETLLPDVAFLEKALRAGGVAFVDQKTGPEEGMDDVPSTGEKFIRADALRALGYVQKLYIDDYKRITLESARQGSAGDPRPNELKIPEGATILGRRLR